jgi:hypothetical protein
MQTLRKNILPTSSGLKNNSDIFTAVRASKILYGIMNIYNKGTSGLGLVLVL